MRLALLFGPVALILSVFCLVWVITTPEARMRHLPKIAWVLIVLFFPLVGSLAWLVAGRPVTAGAASSRWEREAPEFPEYDRPGRAAATDPAADGEFLRQVRERAEEQRRRAAELKKRQEAGDDPQS